MTERKYLCGKSHERFGKGKTESHKENEKKRRTGSAERRRRKMTGCEFPASHRLYVCLCDVYVKSNRRRAKIK